MSRPRSLLVLVVLACLGVPGAARGATVPQESRQLARAYQRATTTTQRKTAILGIARAVGLPVLKARTLAPVVKGRGSARGPYLYDVEVDGLASATRRRARVSFDEIAAQLSGHFPADLPPFLGRELQAASAAGVAAARSGRTKGRAALVPLLADELAKADGVNLRSVAAGTPALDPVLGVLAVADVTAAMAPRLARAPRAQPRAAGPCEGLSGPTTGAGNGAKWILGAGGAAVGNSAAASAVAKKVAAVLGDALLAVGVVTDAIHGVALGYSIGFIDVTAKGEDTTGFGHSGFARAGEPVTLKAELDMLDSYSTGVIRCGALAGYTIPPKGPISGARVGWSPDAQRDPADFGLVDCPATTCESTDGNGTSTWKLTPDDELLPGQGTAIVQFTAMQAQVVFQGASGNTLGGIAEKLGFRKSISHKVAVRWHQPRGYHLELPSVAFHHDSDNGESDDDTHTFANMDQCLPGPSIPHPTYPPSQISIGLLPGTPLAEGSRIMTHTVHHFPSSPDQSDDALGQPFLLGTGGIPAGPLSPTVVQLRNPWSVPYWSNDAATIDAGWFSQGDRAAVQFTFTAPNYSPGQITAPVAPTESTLCDPSRFSGGR